MGDLDARIERTALPVAIDKPAEQHWEGCDEAWDDIFRRHRIRSPGGVKFSRNLKRTGDPQSMSVGPLDLTWRRLPDGAPGDALPQIFSMPSVAWDYGAVSAAFGSVTRPARIAIGLEGLKGEVGVGLMRPDGVVLGVEHKVTTDDGAVVLSFSLWPGVGPIHLLLRNYGREGEGGVVRVDWVGMGEPE